MPFAQLVDPVSQRMLNAAEQTDNWVVVVLVGLIVVILGAFSVVGTFGGRYVLKRLSEQDRYIQDTLVKVVQECSAQISSNTDALDNYTQASRDVISRLDGRPCQWVEVRNGHLVMKTALKSDEKE
jgi:hypothetical protein